MAFLPRLHRRRLSRAALFALAAVTLAVTLGTVGHAQPPAASPGAPAAGRDYKHDRSPNLRDIPPKPYVGKQEHEAASNPRAVSIHKNQPDTVVQSAPATPAMPAALKNFEGVGFPGVACNCAPPDTNGEVGKT